VSTTPVKAWESNFNRNSPSVKVERECHGDNYIRSVVGIGYFFKKKCPLPLTLIPRILGLALAWCWKGLRGALNIGFYLVNPSAHLYIISPQLYLYPITIALPTTVMLFLICWWVSRKTKRG